MKDAVLKMFHGIENVLTSPDFQRFVPGFCVLREIYDHYCEPEKYQKWLESQSYSTLLGYSAYTGLNEIAVLLGTGYFIWENLTL